MSAKGGEFFYRDKDGEPQDENLHEEILAGDHPIAKNIGKEQARKAGLTEAEIMKLFADE